MRNIWHAGVRGCVPSPIRALRWRYPWLKGRATYSERPWRTTWRLADWTLREMLFDEIAFTAEDGARLVSMPANSTSFLHFVEGDHDRDMRNFIVRRLLPGDVFVDVGANIGLYSIMAARCVGTGGRVIAIEAHPRTFEFLRRNVAANAPANVTAINVAAGEQEGAVRIAYVEADAGSTHVAAGEGGGVDTPMSTLDAVLAAAGVRQIQYLKIDVEGFELSVLRGARGTLAASPDIVVQVEHLCGAQNPYGHAEKDAFALLRDHGLAPFRADAEGRLNPQSEMQLVHGSGDVLWVRPGA